jgi:hypothetical protein
VPDPNPVRTAILDRAGVAALAAWADEIGAWPVGSHVYGQYAEETANGPAICRTEYVSACHAGVATLARGVLRDCAADALGVDVEPFKDKVNYKAPGGAGFRPHQDQTAYPGVGRVMSVLVAIDECSTESGCLWLADGVDRTLPVDDRGVVRDDVARDLDWFAAPLAPGDAVCIDGFAPHYSDANRSDARRRVLVVSYAPATEDYGYDHYYHARQERMTAATQRDGRFRISTLADFDGKEVAAPHAVLDHCTHP